MTSMMDLDYSLQPVFLKKHGVLKIFIIPISYTARIPIFSLADLCHVILDYDKTTSWCHYRGVIQVSVSLCSVFNLNNKNINALIAC